MLNQNTFVILKHELKEKLLSRSFLIMTLMMPLFIGLMIGVQYFINKYEGDKGTKLEIVTDSTEDAAVIQATLDQREFEKTWGYTISIVTLDEVNIQEHISLQKEKLLSKKLDAIIYFSSTSSFFKNVDYYSSAGASITVFDKISKPFNDVCLKFHFNNLNISEKDVDYISRPVNFQNYKVSREEGFKEVGFGNIAAAMAFCFLIYFSLMLGGSMLLGSVQEEKTSKVVEIMLSSVNSKELMTGKILASIITSLLQMIIWLIPVVIIIYSPLSFLPPQLTFDISPLYFVYFLLNFITGLTIYHGLYAALGALFPNPRDAQSGVMPIMMLILIPFFISFAALKSPSSPLIAILSYIPFLTIMLMPVRAAVIELPFWHLIISIGINCLTLLTIFPFAGKLYSIGLLYNRQKPSWRTILSWARAKSS